MSTAMARYFNTTMTRGDDFGDDLMGHPVVGADDEVMLEAAGLEAVGFSPMAAMMRARQNAQARRAARWQSRCRHMPGGGYGGGFRNRSDDELGWDGDEDVGDDDDLGADEDEIDDLGEDDEDLGAEDDDSPEAIGASVTRISDRIDRLKAKRAKLQAKLAATPRFRTRRRARLQRMIGRVEAKIARKQGRIRAKQEKARARFGSAVPTGAGQPGGTIAQGFNRLGRNRTGGLYRASAPSGAELYIPVKFSGANYLEIDFTAASGAGATGAIDGETDEINYADLLITGVQIAVQCSLNGDAALAQPGADAVVVTELNSLIADGNINLFYDDQVLPGSGEEVSSNSGDYWKINTYRLTGLRDDSVLAKNGSAQLTGLVTNVKDVETNFSIIITAALICQRLRDVVVDRG